MADYFVSSSFIFTCTEAEMLLMAEALEVASDLMMKTPPAPSSAGFAKVFPPKEADDPWSGFLSLFPDPHFPHFGADITSAPSEDIPGSCTVYVQGMTHFQPDPVAKLIQCCCQMTLKQDPLGFEWVESCSKAEPGAFSGGWYAIFPDHVEYETTHEGLAIALAKGTR